jgi:hypothetical protein
MSAIALLPFGYGSPVSQKVNYNRVSDVDWQFGLGMHLFRQFERDSVPKSAPKKQQSRHCQACPGASSGDTQTVGGDSRYCKVTHSRLRRRASRCEKTQRRSRASPDVMHLEMILRPRRRAALKRVDRKKKLRRADSTPHGSRLQVPLGHRSSKVPKTVSVREAKRRSWFHRSVYARNWFPQFRNAENFKTPRKVKKWTKKTYRQCVKEAKLFKGAVHQMRRNSPGSVCRPRLVAPGEWGKILFTLRHRKNRRSRRKGAVRKPVLNPLEHENAVINSVMTDEAFSKGEPLPPSPDNDGTFIVMPSLALEATSLPAPPDPVVDDNWVAPSECPDCEGTSCSQWIRNGRRVGCGF